MSKHIVIDARGRRSSSGRYIDRLVQHLQTIDTKNRYTVLLEPGDSWQPDVKNFSVLECGFKKFSFNPIDQITFARWLNKLEADLVHFWMTPQEPVFYKGARVTTTHDLTMFHYTRAGRLPLPLHWLRMLGYRFLMWHSHRVAKAIIVPTKFVGDDVANRYKFAKDKIFLTYESSEPQIAGKAEPINGIGEKFIMHVGSPFPHKNIERLVDAFTLLKAQHPDLQLVLAGKQEYFMDQLIKKKISRNKYKKDIFVTGFVSDGELKWLYQNASAYVLPSLSEGFGLPGLEAMAHNTPVASSSATCLPEVYGDAAEYFSPFDIKAISVTVDEILTNSSVANKLRTAGKKRLGLYSWEKMAKETFEIYRTVLKD